MKSQIFLLSSLIFSSVLMGQISIPYEKYYKVESFPKSNEKMTFNLQHPFVDFPDSVLDIKSTFQYQMKMPVLEDSMLCRYINFAMLSLNFEPRFSDFKNGAEIWYGVSKTTIPTVVGIYYKNVKDSTLLYVMTGFSMTYFDKKSKTDLSEKICERIRLICEKNEKRGK